MWVFRAAFWFLLVAMLAPERWGGAEFRSSLVGEAISIARNAARIGGEQMLRDGAMISDCDAMGMHAHDVDAYKTNVWGNGGKERSVESHWVLPGVVTYDALGNEAQKLSCTFGLLASTAWERFRSGSERHPAPGVESHSSACFHSG